MAMTAEDLSHRYTTDASGCWLWLGCKDDSGYGLIRRNGRTQKAHRYVWAQERGPIESKAMLCHRCDTPACVNPAHMFIGTQRDNMRDMVLKGRSDRSKKPKGERHGHSRLTEADVLKMRNDPRSRSEIAREHGVSVAAVSMAVRGVTWGHVSG